MVDFYGKEFMVILCGNFGISIGNYCLNSLEYLKYTQVHDGKVQISSIITSNFRFSYQKSHKYIS